MPDWTFTFGRSARAAEPTDLTYFTWATYEAPELHPAYVKKHGGSPTSTLFVGANEALQKIRSGFTPDLVHPCSENIGLWHDAAVLEPIDTERLRNTPSTAAAWAAVALLTTSGCGTSRQGGLARGRLTRAT